MRRRQLLLALWVLVGVALAAFPAAAQQITVQSPQHIVNDSFFERIGTQWGVNFKNGFFRFGGGGMGMPQFGGANPNAGVNGGFAFRGGNVNGQFNFAAGQGMQRSMVSQTPMVTVPNGMPGMIADTSLSPFVMGYVPVVGYYPTIPVVVPAAPTNAAGVGSDAVRAALQQTRGGQAAADPAAAVRAAAPANLPQKGQIQNRQQPPKPKDDLALREPQPVPLSPASTAEKVATAQASSAGRAAPSVAEARRLRATESSAEPDEALVYWQRAVNAEESGNLGAAKIYYQMAARRATGELKQRAADRLTALRTAPSDPR